MLGNFLENETSFSMKGNMLGNTSLQGNKIAFLWIFTDWKTASNWSLVGQVVIVNYSCYN